MGPPKRKGTLRRQVLDIKSREDSPSRPTWQNKYQHILAADVVQNGDSQSGSSEMISSTTSTSKPSLSLVGNYNSDSETDEGDNLDSKVEDFLKEIQSITPAESVSTNHNPNHAEAGPSVPTKTSSKEESLYPASVTAWQQCLDQGSGYPYYWNMHTNEVTWEMPPDLKAALANVAAKQQQQKDQATKKQAPKSDKLKKSLTTVGAGKKIYPWQTGSDSEDEKIEMITSFGPQSGEESEGEEKVAPVKPPLGIPLVQKKKPKMSKIVKKETSQPSVIGPQLPIGPLLPDRDDTEAEALHEQSYETSSLMTTYIQDTGPPGVENHARDMVTSTQVAQNTSVASQSPRQESGDVAPDSSAKEDAEERQFEEEEGRREALRKKSVNSDSGKNSVTPTSERLSENENSSEQSGDENDSILSKLRSKAKLLEKMGGEVPVEIKAMLESIESNVASPTTSAITDNEVSKSDEVVKSENCAEEADDAVNADDIIALIEKETPPDYPTSGKLDIIAESSIAEPNRAEPSIAEPSIAEPRVYATESKPSSFALIAGYGDDSDTEEGSFHEKRTPVKASKPLFPIADIMEQSVSLTPSTSKVLFPWTEDRTGEPQGVETRNEAESLLIDSSLPDSTTTHKAFKRKKRIELTTTIYGPSTSKAVEPEPEVKPSFSSGGSNTQYNMDPSSNEHRGLGFSSGVVAVQTGKKNFFNSGGIQFIKAETINVKEGESSERKLPSTKPTEKTTKSSQKAVDTKDEDIEDTAALLREKMTFLAEGKEPVSPVQQMAIQLETLFSAWQHGALTPSYLSRWLQETSADLAQHEKSAAPLGWTCSWDRKNKRYFYRNTASKVVQWDYPEAEAQGRTQGREGGKDPEGGADEMDLCDTPPHTHMSEADEPPLTPPPPIISEAAEESSVPSPTPPPPPVISFSPAKVTSRRKKRKTEEVSSSSEGDAEPAPQRASQVTTSTFFSPNEQTAAPPLPPMPPPPPPPPDDPPPPLPSSPPPIPIDPDQPLPPGVDEPEYIHIRRNSPPRINPLPPDSSTYTPDILMSYAYGMVSSSSQAIPPMLVNYQDGMPYVQPTHVIHCPPAKKAKISLTSELDSFYSDIALLEGENSEPVAAPAAPVAPVSAPTSAVETVHVEPAPLPTTSAASTSHSQNVTNDVGKRKKKTKLAPGLSMKKKGVSSLVAKWQQVQEEERRYNDDDEDDDDVSSTHK